MLPRMRACLHGLTIALTLAVWPAIAGAEAPRHGSDTAQTIVAASPDPALAADLFGLGDKMPRLEQQDAPVPGWRVAQGAQAIGMIGSTWEMVGSTGYSGRPLDVLVAVTPEGLARLPLIGIDWGVQYTTEPHWRDWFLAHLTTEPPPLRHVAVYSSSGMGLEAAAAGQGDPARA